ncbi:HAMP domain-containing sensor histidine kinase [Seleniivibrio woodruffii]|uniref:HAMP domain-containing sensor histidine kinase n=1 Tax=Seleniivibrio woodruffii TaxID=1078050 RepID=UPI0026F28BD8|nr:HAMP domain-containing sensor histidine kinase [Seleniivibrio woodruffii]
MKYRQEITLMPRINSLFTKMAVLTSFAALILNFAFFGAFHYYSITTDTRTRSNFTDYVKYLVKDVGNPPQKANAEAIATRAKLFAKYESPAGSWTAGIFKDDFNDRKLFKFYDKDGLSIASAHGYTRIISATDNGSLTLLMSPEKGEISGLRILLFILCGMVVVMLFGLLFFIGKMLSPVRKMFAAIEEVKKGNYGHKILHKGKDELAQLCCMFNELTADIERAIRSREQLLADVSHELRTPLTSMRVAADMVEDNELKQSLIEDIMSMETLTGKVLESARLGIGDKALEMDSVDFSALAERCVRRFASMGGKIQANIGDGIKLCANSLMMESLLNNLLENAVKYSVNSHEPVLLQLSADADGLTVSVRDKGQGIPAKDLPFIFEPFYRSDSARTRNTGYGLGLSLCKKIVEMHGGTITVKSEESVGTEVVFTLPPLLIKN